MMLESRRQLSTRIRGHEAFFDALSEATVFNCCIFFTA